MWSVQANSDFLSALPFFVVYFIQLTHLHSFWKLAIPIMIVVIPIALMGDLMKLWHYMEKKTATRKAVKVSFDDLSLRNTPSKCNSMNLLKDL